MTIDNDNIARLANDLAQRMRWEQEHGGVGYDPGITAKIAEIAVAPAESPVHKTENEDRQKALVELRNHIGECSRCELHSDRTNLVFGDGNPEASVVFVGEGPGHDEDMQGIPFVGAAGQLLDKIIGAMGLNRQQVYICNVVKCRPPNNRVPSPAEHAACGEFLLKQLQIINPEVVVALGSTAARYLLNSEASLGKLRGTFHEFHGMVVMPTYHPAYLLRNPAAKRDVWNDMQMVMAKLNLAKKQ